jgi:ribulose-5-phosphate 4-epimerase/fuculose-1-phosphate aldolase
MHADARPDHIDPEEWQIRIDLAAAYRLVAHFGWDDLIFTHLSARLPGADHRFLINPYGMMFHEITASSLVKVYQAGNIVADNGYRINPAGFTIHSAIHMAKEDAGSVMHLHNHAGTAVSAQKDGLLPITQTAMLVYPRIAYHDYEGVALNMEEQERLCADLGEREAMVLRNHGLLTVGPTVAECFNNMWRLERACQIQIAALSCNTELSLPPKEVVDQTTHLYQRGTRRPFGLLEWPTMLRKLDRENPGYDA